MFSRLNNQQGLTLIELVVSMMIISVALAGVLSVMFFTTSHSADPVVQRQAISIAESYMEEITLKSFLDPDDGQPCPEAEGDRASFDNVCDYDGLNDVGAHDPDGNMIAGLENYEVSVSVEKSNEGPVGKEFQALKIAVVVKDPAGKSLALNGYRFFY